MCDKKEKQLELDKRYLRMAAVWGTDSKRPNDYF